MELARETWTDERLDDLVHRMDGGFARVESHIEREADILRAEMRAGFANAEERLGREVGSLRAEMRELRNEMSARFESLQRTLLVFYGGLVLALIGIAAALA